jgi:hypothetical protein
VYVRDLKQMWSASSDIHSVVNSHPVHVQLDKVDKAIAKLRLALASANWQFEAAPKRCAWKCRFYEHAILEHLSEKLTRLMVAPRHFQEVARSPKEAMAMTRASCCCDIFISIIGSSGGKFGRR